MFLALVALGGLVLIAFVSYLSLSSLLGSKTLDESLFRSYSYPLFTFMFLWAVFYLAWLVLGVPLGVHGSSASNAMNYLGLGGGTIARFIAALAGFTAVLCKRNMKVDMRVVLFSAVVFLWNAHLFFASGAAFPLGSWQRTMDTAMSRVAYELRDWLIGPDCSPYYYPSRGFILGMIGISLIPYAWLLDEHRSLRTLLLCPGLVLWARQLTRICDYGISGMMTKLPLAWLSGFTLTLPLMAPLFLLVLWRCSRSSCAVSWFWIALFVPYLNLTRDWIDLYSEHPRIGELLSEQDPIRDWFVRRLKG